MSLIGNIIWIVFGGFFIFLEYLVSGLLMCLTIIGIPFGIQLLKLSIVGLVPFGTEVKPMEHSNGCISTVMNIIWLILGGIWIALTHLVFGFLFTITIIGIPFGMQHFKLAGLALTPFGKGIG